jgi:hypothetical protein
MSHQVRIKFEASENGNEFCEYELNYANLTIDGVHQMQKALAAALLGIGDAEAVKPS